MVAGTAINKRGLEACSLGSFYIKILGNYAFSSSLRWKLRIGSCLVCIYRVMDAHGKFGRARKKHRSCLRRSREEL